MASNSVTDPILDENTLVIVISQSGETVIRAAQPLARV